MSWFSRLTHAFNSRRLDDDLAAEFRDHLERRTSDFIRGGLSPEAARVAAIRAFGNVGAIQEVSRATKTATTIESTWQDVRYAWRGLKRRPIFSLASVLSISLAAGATTAVYALANATALRPLAVPDPSRLFALVTSAPTTVGPASGDDKSLFSYPLYEELRAAAGTSARLALLDDPHRAEVRAGRGDDASDDVVSQYVSPDLFDILGVPPAAGQLFSTADTHVPSSRSVVVLSHDYWTRRFAADPAIVGRTVTVDGRPSEVLGVTRQGFRGIEPGAFIDLWRPITAFDPSVFTNAEFRSFRLFGRLGPDTTSPQLSARLQPAFRRHVEARLRTSATHLPPGEQAQLQAMTLVVTSGRTGVSGFRQTFSRPLWVLLGLATAILFLACSNVAGLVLARSRARSAEIALRIALGAGRRRLFRQFMAEGSLISLLGAAGGWPIARLLAQALVRLVSTNRSPVHLDLSFDASVLTAVVVACGLSAILIGALPAWGMLALPNPATLRRLGRQATKTVIGRALVTAQIAFAVCLVATGAAFVVTLTNLTAVDVGFDAQNVTVLTMANDLGPSQRPLQLQLTREIQGRVAALPGVQSAATAWWAMFSGARRTQRVALPGQTMSEQEELFYRVSPKYLATLKVPLLSGRDLNAQDNDDEPVPAVVTVSFARKYFHEDSPLGRIFIRDDGVRHEVVGVAGDSRYDALRGGPEPIVYMPMKPPGVFTLYVRAPMASTTIAAMVTREAGALGFGMRVRDVTTLRTLVDDTIVTERVLAGIGSVCALMGLVLAVIGLFGLLNYSVTERTQEIGIRTALGASRRGIYALVTRQVVGPIVVGIAIGLATAVAAIHGARSLLFGVTSVDPVVMGLALLVFSGAAAVACAIPARRAAAIDPVIALRHD